VTQEEPIKIVKTDEDGNRLEGAKFSVISENAGGGANLSRYMSELTPYSNYYFEAQSDGIYKSNNQNQSDTTAVSYMEIDLSETIWNICI
jgi:hypothetical protein